MSIESVFAKAHERHLRLVPTKVWDSERGAVCFMCADNAALALAVHYWGCDISCEVVEHCDMAKRLTALVAP